MLSDSRLVRVGRRNSPPLASRFGDKTERAQPRLGFNIEPKTAEFGTVSFALASLFRKQLRSSPLS